MLKLNVDNLKQRIEDLDDFQTAGHLVSVQGVVRATLPAGIGELCKIALADGSTILSEVIGFDNQNTMIMPLRKIDRLEPGATVVALKRRISVPLGKSLLGRVVDALGTPIDGKGYVYPDQRIPIDSLSPPPMERPKISEPFITGQRAIDGMLTMGRGQRIGLFAGSGVGKSTLLGEIAKRSDADINVVALIGERGREVKPFVEECIGAAGMAKSIVIVATADQAPLLRIRAAQSAVTMANWFRSQGANVLFMVDSLTRLAMAQRELGLLLNEPPASRGYPPSAIQLLANLMEPLGCTREGSVTGLMTVLVDGDDVNEPIADAVRGILDGHIVLDRKLAEKGHYPSINIARSISRVQVDVTDDSHLQWAKQIRNVMSTYDDVVDLIRIGAYQKGTSPQIDKAIAIYPVIQKVLQQEVDEYSSFDQTRQLISQIAAAWPF